MGLELAPSIWVAITAVCGVSCWLMGERHGARSAWGLGPDFADDVARSESDALFTLTIGPASRPIAQEIDRQDGEAAATDGQSVEPYDDGARERTQQRIALFSEMPPVEEVRQHARQLLSDAKVWTAPDLSGRLDEALLGADRASLGLMRHYRNAIDELCEVNARRPIGGARRPEADPALPVEMAEWRRVRRLTESSQRTAISAGG